MEINNNGEVRLLTDEEVKYQEKSLIKQKKALETKKKEYSNLLNTKTGIEFLREIAAKSGFLNKHCGLYQGNSTDPLKLAFADGYRELFLEIINLLNEELLIKILNNGK